MNNSNLRTQTVIMFFITSSFFHYMKFFSFNKNVLDYHNYEKIYLIQIVHQKILHFLRGSLGIVYIFFASGDSDSDSGISPSSRSLERFFFRFDSWRFTNVLFTASFFKNSWSLSWRFARIFLIS